MNCLSLFLVSDFCKFVDMRNLCFFLIYMILTKQTSSQTTSCSSYIGSGSDLSNFDSYHKKEVVQACIQNIHECAKGELIALFSATPTPQVMTSDSTYPMTSQTMSTSSKANDKIRNLIM